MKKHDMYRYGLITEGLAMSDKFKYLMDRTKKIYGDMMSRALADSLEYMESEDVKMIQETMELMNDALELSVEYVKQNEEYGKEIVRIKKTVEENNRLLKRLVYGKREV